MSWEIVLVLAILAGAVALFISERFPIDLVALLVLGTLLAFGLVTPEQGISGFSNPATVTVAAMFVLSAGCRRPVPRPSSAGCWCATAATTSPRWWW
jgi:di/tricarboxylate transporter